MIIKLDMEKTFEWIESSFIRNVLTFYNFPEKLIKLILSCVTSSFLSILVNGRKTEQFQPTRGIHQGDPLSHLYAWNILSNIITTAVNRKA